MSYYTIIPEEMYGENENEELNYMYSEVELGGVLMQVRMDGGNRATIVRLLRCSSLNDYLNPAYAPGGQIAYIPMLLR
ncbi:hypothetical protein J2T12_003985 [Paenibacillus anaericanus]|uniref:YlzJ-like family protein n=1 Tax=Paenibacillus TaxID=44249 RepID=UPI0027868A52|nr:YlzJ-like family protein [Paenibacillus anaericanus]MDQ0090562.1 hypothetical protein [Paenibacillus anaericanus]